MQLFSPTDRYVDGRQNDRFRDSADEAGRSANFHKCSEEVTCVWVATAFRMRWDRELCQRVSIFGPLVRKCYYSSPQPFDSNWRRTCSPHHKAVVSKRGIFLAERVICLNRSSRAQRYHQQARSVVHSRHSCSTHCCKHVCLLARLSEALLLSLLFALSRASNLDQYAFIFERLPPEVQGKLQDRQDRLRPERRAFAFEQQ